MFLSSLLISLCERVRPDIPPRLCNKSGFVYDIFFIISLSVPRSYPINLNSPSPFIKSTMLTLVLLYSFFSSSPTAFKSILGIEWRVPSISRTKVLIANF